MAVNYTPIVNGADANATTFNGPLQQLDDAIEDIKDGTSAMSAPQITSFASSQHDHSDAANGGLIPFDNLDTTGETVGNLLAVGPSNNVVTVSNKWEVGDIIPKAKVSDTANVWLRLDGRTIGNASSGGTARANADMETLFTHLWTEFTNTELVIQDSSGTPTTRGASAAADWAANKRMPIPDSRGRVLAGMDDPTGSSAANVVTDAGADALGGSMGAETHTLTWNELAVHGHTVPVATSAGVTVAYGTRGSAVYGNNVSTSNAGGGLAHNNMQPTMFLNYFIYTGN